MRAFLVIFYLFLSLGGTWAQSNFPIAPYKAEKQDKKEKSFKSDFSKLSLQEFADGLFLKSEVSNSNPYKNELVRIDWVIFYPYAPHLNVDFEVIDHRLPNLPDFVKERVLVIADEDTIGVQSVNINGISYRSRKLLCFYMLPVDVGTFRLSEGYITIQLYNSGSTYGKPLTLNSNSKAITVEQIKNEPDDFTGAIGVFQISSQLLPSADSITCGNTFIYRLNLKGNGNFNFVRAPKISFPTSFDVDFKPGFTNLDYSSSNCKGERSFDFYVTPRYPGKFQIPEVTFSFMNSNTRKFKRVSCHEVVLNVYSSNNRNDILSIDSVLQHNDDSLAVNQLDNVSERFLLVSPHPIVGIIVLLFALISFFLWKKKISNRHSSGAVSPEEDAYAGMLAANSSLKGEEFYKKSIDLLLAYVGKKLNCKVATQSKVVLHDMLAENGVSEQTIDKVIRLIDCCEQVCYSGNHDFSNKEIINDLFCEVIDELESDLSKSFNCSSLI